MSDAYWQLSRHEARVQTGQLIGVVDTSRPGCGLHNLVPPQWGDSILQVHRGSNQTECQTPARDAYVRQTDLIATYGETADQSFSTQIYWRSLPAELTNQTRAAIELVVSAETDLLRADPSITTVSRLPQSDVLHLVATDIGKTDTVTPSEVQFALSPGDGSGCIIVRLPDTDISYVEMVHPSDFLEVELSRDARGSAHFLKRTLICRSMEKGVIVRSRLRGLFIERADDVATAIIAYRRFCESSAPLTV